jgi:hypothetical protein
VSDLRVLRELGDEFERVAHATPPRRRGRARLPRHRRALVLAVIAAILAAAVAVAASGVLTGEPVHNRKGVSFSPTRGLGTPVMDTVRLLGLRVPDPQGGLPWGLRTLRTTRSLACVQVGRVHQGKLGVLGQDGAFGNDGRFHELPANVLSGVNCQTTDAAGHGFVAVSYQGLPASAMDGFCRARDMPAPRRLKGIRAPAPTPRCPAADERIVYYGLLGPDAESVSYRAEDGRIATAATSGRDGGYLVVLRPTAQHPARGYFAPGASPGSGLLSVRYRDGHVCRIRSPRALGGAKPCPRVGYVVPRMPRLTDAQVAAPVTAHISLKPVLVPGRATIPPDAQRQWKLTISFRARIAGDAKSYYIVEVAPAEARRCQFGTMFSPVARDVGPGELVRQTFWVPARCHGLVRGAVWFHQPDARRADPLPFSAVPGKGPLVGTYTVKIPR